jgi:hypothetical protein
MNSYFLIALSASTLLAQTVPTVYGKVTVSGPAVTRKLAGAQAKSIMLGNINVCATAPIAVAVTDIKIHISDLDFANETDAVSIITSSYNSQLPQKLGIGVSIGAAAIGAVEGFSPGALAARVMGYLLAGFGVTTGSVIPALEANQASLAAITGNQLISMGTNGMVSLAPGQCISNARVFVTRAGKSTLIPYIENFSFVPGTAPTTLRLHSDNSNTGLYYSYSVGTDASVSTADNADVDPAKMPGWWKQLHAANTVAEMDKSPIETHPQLDTTAVSGIIPTTTQDIGGRPVAHLIPVKAVADSQRTDDIQQIRLSLKAMQSQMDALSARLDELSKR